MLISCAMLGRRPSVIDVATSQERFLFHTGSGLGLEVSLLFTLGVLVMVKCGPQTSQILELGGVAHEWVGGRRSCTGGCWLGRTLWIKRTLSLGNLERQAQAGWLVES